NDFPSPRHTTARISGRPTSWSMIPNSSASIASSNALCLSGLSLVIVATGPSTSSRTPAIARKLPRDVTAGPGGRRPGLRSALRDLRDLGDRADAPAEQEVFVGEALGV